MGVPFIILTTGSASGPVPLDPIPLPAPSYLELVERTLAGLEGPIHYSFRYERRSLLGVFREDVTTSVITGNIDLDNERATLRTATFQVDGRSFPADWDYRGGDFLQVWCDLALPGDEVARFPLGFFQLVQPSLRLGPGGRGRTSIKAADLSDYIARTYDDDPYNVAAGTDYLAEANDIITGLGARSDIQAIGGASLAAQVFPPNTNRRDIVNALGLAANFYTPWADELGVFRVTPRLTGDQSFDRELISVAAPSFIGTSIDLAARTDVTYSTQREPRMINSSDMELVPEVNRLANVATLTWSSPPTPGTAGVGIYIVDNIDPRSPINAVAVGRRALNQPLLDRVTDVLWWGAYELARADAGTDTLHFTSLFDPRRTAHEFYRIDEPQLPEDARGWMVLGWSMPLDTSGKMKHRAAICRGPLRFTVVATL